MKSGQGIENVYTPITRTKLGFAGSMRMFLRDVWHHRQQIGVRMSSDWAGIYRGSYLGTFWAIVMAVTPMSVFMVLGWMRIIPTVDAMPYPIYIAAGTTIWMLIAESITISITALPSATASLSGSQMPMSVGLMSRYGILFSDTLIRFVALLIWIMLSAGALFSWHLLLFPILMIPVLMFGIGLGLILSAFNVVFPDVDPLTGMILRYAVFFSCAFLPLPSDMPILQAFLHWNVPAQLVMGVREATVLGFDHVADPAHFGMACMVSVIVFALGVRTFYRLEPHIQERL